MKHFLSAFFCVFLLSLQAAESAAQNCAWRFRDDGSAVFSWTTEKRGPLMRIAVTGADGGRLKELCDVALCVPARKANHIQELHIAVGHMLCGLVEKALHG